jgi:hypothetical protein
MDETSALFFNFYKQLFLQGLEEMKINFGMIETMAVDNQVAKEAFCQF